MKIFRIISYLKILRFYKGIFPLRRTAMEFIHVLCKGKARVPVTVDILVTKKCNLSCDICFFLEHNTFKGPENTEDMTCLELDILFRDLAGFCPVVHFGGGEPFTREDMSVLIKKVKQKGLKCLVTTNGTLLNGKNIIASLNAGLDGIIISVYGDRGFHDKVTGKKGSFDHILEAVGIIKNNKKQRQKVYFSTVIMPDFPDAAEKAAAIAFSAGVDGFKLEHLNFITEREREELENRLGRGIVSSYTVKQAYSVEKSQAIAGMIIGLKKKYGDFIMVKPDLSRDQMISWYTTGIGRERACSFIRHSAVIDHKGDVIPCQFLPGIVWGNVKTQKILDIWNNSGAASPELFPGYYPVCYRCCKQ